MRPLDMQPFFAGRCDISDNFKKPILEPYQKAHLLFFDVQEQKIVALLSIFRVPMFL